MLAPDQTRQSAVFDHLRHSILSGALPGGGRLPPSRSLAQELGVARQTVVLAYERLAAEGYVRGRTGSGTYVATDLPDQAPAPAVDAAGCRGRAVGPGGAAGTGSGDGIGARPGPGTAAGRRTAGARSVSDQGLGALRLSGAEAVSGEVSSYPPPQGLLVLREQIAAHLAATRGLVADPGCIVVTGGTQQALRTAADLLVDPGDPVWVEDPGYIAGPGRVARGGGGDRAGSE